MKKIEHKTTIIAVNVHNLQHNLIIVKTFKLKQNIHKISPNFVFL